MTTHWEKHDSVYILNRLPNPLTSSRSLLACYDIDGTLIEPTDPSKTWAEGVDDWQFREGMLEEVRLNQADGLTVLFFTNQGRSANRHITLARLESVAVNVGQCCIFAATGKDKNRKPQIGMWKLAVQMLGLDPDLEQSFYCGDATGLRGSFSDSDLKFAENIGLPFLLPIGIEELPEEEECQVNIPTVATQETVILVGAQGSGKTYIAIHNFPSYTHVSKDLQGARHVKVLTTALQEGKSVVIDNTNPTIAGRAEYLRVARELGVPVRIIVVDTPLAECKKRNQLREKPVPTIAYNIYAKNYQEPTDEEAPILHV
jgi:bifunctional polynucleotide phosphatase/kinase